MFKQATDATVTVEVRGNSFELRVDKSGTNEWRQALFLVQVPLQIGQKVAVG